MVNLVNEVRARLAEGDGFVMPVVIFALVVLGVVGVAALVTAGDEQRSSRATRESGEAFYAAEAGLNQVWANWNDSLMASLTPGDSVDLGWQTLDNGASYRALVRRYDNAGGGQSLVGLRVEGRGAGPVGGQRVLSYQVTIRKTIINVQGAMVSVPGFMKTGSSGTISGFDSAPTTGPGSCPEAGQDTIAGVVAPDSSIWQGNPVPANVVDSTTAWLAGDPKYHWGGTTEDVIAMLDIDWAGFLAMTPDIVIDAIADWPSSVWWTVNGNAWPVIKMNGNVDLSGVEGRGILIVPDSLEFGGGFVFDGLILAGDKVHTHGSTTVRGAIFTGLNALLGLPVSNSSDLGNGTKTILYNSCNIIKASQSAWDRVDVPRRSRLLASRAFAQMLR